MENGNTRFVEIEHGFYANLRIWLPAMRPWAARLLTTVWLLVMLLLALYGLFEPRAEFHYLAM